MQAEMENLRKRLIRDQEKSRKFALERIMKDLLQVRDSMERGLEADAESASAETLLEGQALTLKMLTKVMQDHNLELVDPKGEAFNPEFHEASYSLGLLLAESKDYEGAVVYLAKAAKGMPERARVHYNLGLLLQYLNRAQEAEVSLMRAVQLEPGNGSAQSPVQVPQSVSRFGFAEQIGPTVIPMISAQRRLKGNTVVRAIDFVADLTADFCQQ